MQEKHPLFNLMCIILVFVSWTGVFLVWRTNHAPAPNSIIKNIPLLVGEGLGGVSTTPKLAGVSLLPTSSTQKQQIANRPFDLVGEPTVATTTDVLPKEINLAVPFTSQAPEKIWIEPWEDACEEAAVLMIDAYEKGYHVSPLFAKDELLKMVAWEESQGYGISIDAEQVTKLIAFYSGKKVTVRRIEDPSVEQIKILISQKKPVLVLADGKALNNPHFTNGGPAYHALVIRGYTGDSFITNDPGTQFGENYVYPIDVLMNAIRDWNNGDVKNGKRIVLVID